MKNQHLFNDRDDPYRASKKPPEPTSCPECRATFQDGRWTWGKAPADSNEQLCPACQRIRDEFPAGFVTIKGDYLKGHRDEILAVINGKDSLDVPVEIGSRSLAPAEATVRHRRADRNRSMRRRPSSIRSMDDAYEKRR